MEEREALKRQIELLENLINTHKSVHGDNPFPRLDQRHSEISTSSRGRGNSTAVIHPHSSRGRLYSTQSRGTWRKTYSLKNKNPETNAGHPSASTSSFSYQSSSTNAPHRTSMPSGRRGEEKDGSKPTALPAVISQEGKEEHIKSVATEKKKTVGIVAQHQSLHRQPQELQQKPEHRHVVLPEKKVTVPADLSYSVKANTSSSLQSSPLKPSLQRKNSTELKQANTTVVPLSALSKVTKQPSVKPIPQTSLAQVSASFLNRSKFIWVKNQDVGGAVPSSVSSPTIKAMTVTPISVSKAGVAAGSSTVFSTSKKTPTKKLPRKLSPIIVASKTSKYRWVSSSARAQAKQVRKPASPKTLTLSQKTLEKGELAKKPRTPPATSTKLKKGMISFLTNPSISNSYRWKAGGLTSSAASTGAATATRRRSAFHWTSEKSYKNGKKGFVSPTSVTQRSASTASPGAFKLRSRMKIIRKPATSGGGSEKVTSPSAVKISPRSKNHSLTRTPTGIRRTPSRELVSFGRHKLRRLPSAFSRASSASSSQRSPSSQRVFRTRYKMVTRPGSSTTYTPHYNPALSWRTKRLQSARSFLQSRLRQPSPTQHWKGTGMCWIRGSLYRVSANKLSRTVASNMSINRTGRSFSPAQASSMSPAYSRPSTSQHLASRAVQRSLAIIRHARNKKQQKQYCMYYNRFGKCNRGNSCPYIHDPDKVAVCTRFLRGTCKQADGTCPFSHKVAKEKMPVCSYFLKGICNNSDCPYSHVYVSRKAEVCEDFVKGYCPEGEKCKKKHTLVCPDFSKTGSCPRGAACKLQHRQRVKRSTSNTSILANRSRTSQPAKRPRLSVIIPQDSQAEPGMPADGPLKLPSYISLSSSPEEADTPETVPAENTKVKEKKLQIKPRL